MDLSASIITDIIPFSIEPQNESKVVDARLLTHNGGCAPRTHHRRH